MRMASKPDQPVQISAQELETLLQAMKLTSAKAANATAALALERYAEAVEKAVIRTASEDERKGAEEALRVAAAEAAPRGPIPPRAFVAGVRPRTEEPPGPSGPQAEVELTLGRLTPAEIRGMVDQVKRARSLLAGGNVVEEEAEKVHSAVELVFAERGAIEAEIRATMADEIIDKLVAITAFERALNDFLNVAEQQREIPGNNG